MSALPWESERAVIAYTPLRTEVPWQSFIHREPAYTILPRASLDPFEEARKVMGIIQGPDALLFIPGRRFDVCGTRYGQGGGWYDRFLSVVPRTWTRIGFCFETQFSPTPLHREVHDQEMDYVAVVVRGMLVVHEARTAKGTHHRRH